MREHRYKAWVDKEIIEGRPAEIYQVSTIEWDDDGLESAVLFSPRTETFHTLKAQWFKLIEYTGLKDKNGKEIYEGDILKAQVNDCIWRYLVTTFEGFGNNLFYATRYRNFATDNEGDYYKWGDYFVNEGRTLIQSGNEVIGNIYENPELLEEKKP